jgi:beta-galactosidase
VDILNGKVEIINGYFFKDLGDILLQWNLLENGKVIQKGMINRLDVLPQSSTTVNISFNKNLIQAGAEYFLNFSFQLKASSKWAEKGHEIASEQIALPNQPAQAILEDLKSLPSLQLVQGENIVVKGKGFTTTFSKKQGTLTGYQFKGREFLSAPVVPDFWRVPTDNDEGGKQSSYAARWRASGLDAIAIHPVEMKAELVQSQLVKVYATNHVVLKKGSINYTTVYTVYGNGDIKTELVFEIGAELPPLARVGMQFQMPASFKNITWYGKGPFESYEDRKESAFVGLYKGKLADQYFPYVMPQENGNKTDVRWLLLSAQDDYGLVFTSDSLLSINVQDYSMQELNESKLSHQLKRGSNTYLHIDMKQMGVGGDIGWGPRVHPEYLLTAKKYKCCFWLKPRKKATKSDREL